MLHIRGVSYTLANHPREDQSFLYALTSQTSVPTLLVDEERPRSTWLEQTYMVNSLGNGKWELADSDKQRGSGHNVRLDE